MLNSKLDALPRGILLPDNLIAELEEFISRNVVIKLEAETPRTSLELGKCCIRCLKAHAIRRGMETGLDKVSLAFLEGLFDCETGHDGYYLDSDKLVKIEMKGGFDI